MPKQKKIFSSTQQPTDVNALITDIRLCITNKDSVKLQTLLSSDFIYPGFGPTSLIAYTRPMLEALFIEHTHIFRDIVELVYLHVNSLQICNVFFDSLQGIDLVAGGLFRWNQKIHTDLMVLIKRFDLYKNKNLTTDPSKRQRANDLFHELNHMLMVEHPACISDEAKATTLDKLHVLRYKLDFMKKIHAHDDVFKNHRGWKRFTVNCATAMFAFLPNLINLLVTGNFFFFNKTATIQQGEKMQQTLGVNTSVVFKQEEAKSSSYIEFKN